MNEQTAMQQLLNKLKNDRLKQPMHIAWKRCYESIEEIIKKTYIPIEKEQILDAFWNSDNTDCISEQNSKEFAEKYYNKTYKNK